MTSIEYIKPKSLDEALEAKRKFPEASFIAGGTDIIVKMKYKVKNPAVLISLRSIPDLSGISVSNNQVRIGATTTITDIINNAELGEKLPFLKEAAGSLGSRQIRNVATVGGNLCNSSPCANMAPPLLVLDATVELKSRTANRTLPLHEFFLGPDKNCASNEEIVTAFSFNLPSVTTKALFYKKGRVKMDIASASIAVLLSMDGTVCRKARIAVGSVAPIPLRLFDVEKDMEQVPLTRQTGERLLKRIGESISPITDIRSQKEYREQVILVYFKRALETLIDWN